MKKVIPGAVSLLLLFLIFISLLTINREAIGYFLFIRGARSFAERNHLALAIGGAGGNIFSATTVTDISLRPADSEPQTFNLKLSSLVCAYDLWDLRQDFDSFLQNLRCTADRADFSYDFIRSESNELPAESRAYFAVPPVLPQLEVRNGAVFLSHDEWEVRIENFSGSLQTKPGVHEAELAGKRFLFVSGKEPRVDTGFMARLRYVDNRLVVESLDMGDAKVSATGFFDLSGMEDNRQTFDFDLVFDESRLRVAGAAQDSLLQLKASTENFDIGELQARLGGKGWNIAGTLKAETELMIGLETKKDFSGTFFLEMIGGQFRNSDIETFRVRGRFDDEMLVIPSAEAAISGNQLSLSHASFPLPLIRNKDVAGVIEGSEADFDIKITDVNSLKRLSGTEESLLWQRLRVEDFRAGGFLQNGFVSLENGSITGSDFTVTVEKAKVQLPAENVAWKSSPVYAEAHLVSSNLRQLAGRYDIDFLDGKAAADIVISNTLLEPDAAVEFAGENITVNDMVLGSVTLQADVQVRQEKPGKKNTVRFAIKELRQENGAGRLSLLTPATGEWHRGILTLEALFDIDGEGEIRLALEKVPGEGLAGRIFTRNLSSTGWAGNFIDQNYFFRGAAIELLFSGVPDNPQIQAAGTVSEAGSAETPFPLAGRFSLQYTPRGITIEEFIWKSHDLNRLEIRGFLPYDPIASNPLLKGELTLQGNLEFPALEDIAFLLEPIGVGRGALSLDIDLGGTWQQPLGHVHVEAEGIEPPEAARGYFDSPVHISCDIEAKGETIMLRSASLDSSQYEVQATGSWRHGLSVKKVLTKNRPELQGEVSADAVVHFKDMNFLRRKLAWLRRLEGDMTGEIHVSGSLPEPRVTGSLSLVEGEVSHTFNFPTLTDVALQGDFDERSITITSMQAEVGGAPVSLNGQLRREDEVIDISLHIEGKNVLLYRSSDMRMRGEVRLDVTGPLANLNIKGTTGLTGGYYTRNIDLLGMIGSSSTPVSEGVTFLFSFSEPPLNDANLDIRITTIEPFRVRNNLLRGRLRPEFFLKGTGELPYLVGTIYIDPSRMILPSGRLQIQSGLLRFPERAPDRPQLDMLAYSKVLGYDINVVVSGPLDDPVVTLSSSPFLPNEDLLLLLLTGQPPKQDVPGGAKGSGTANVMVYLGRDFLSKWLEAEPGTADETILDRFELDIGRDVTRSGEQTVESSFRLSDKKGGEGTVFYLTGEKDMYDAYNYGLRVVFRFE